MRTVFPSRELPHIWAHQSAPHGRCSSSMSFAGQDFFSYGATIGRIETNAKGDTAFLVSTVRHSITTSRHQSHMRSAIPSGAREFYVPVIDTPHGILGSWTREVKYTLQNAAKAREPKKTRLIGEAASTVAAMREYAEFSGVKKYPFPVVPGTPAELAEAIAKQHKAEERAQRKHDEARRAELTEDRERWLRGESVQVYSAEYVRLFGTDLRIVGEDVETSRGVTFPISHAKRGLALVRAVMAKGEEWETNGHTCHLGPYRIDRITPDGKVYAGCHIVTWPAIERIAPEVEAYNLDAGQAAQN